MTVSVEIVVIAVVTGATEAKWYMQPASTPTATTKMCAAMTFCAQPNSEGRWLWRLLMRTADAEPQRSSPRSVHGGVATAVFLWQMKTSPITREVTTRYELSHIRSLITSQSTHHWSTRHQGPSLQQAASSPHVASTSLWYARRRALSSSRVIFRSGLAVRPR